MAEPWIKMRTSLRTAPKVVRISSALNADRLRVVGALHAVWSLADEHSPDGLLGGYTLQVVDDLIGWPGFAAAMRDVDWLIETAQGIEVPRFEDHNGASAKRRAMESDRKRSARLSAELPLTGGQTSSSDADKKRTRGEEIRGEEKTGAGAPTPWIPADCWQEFEKHRKAKRAPLTKRAVELIVKKLDDYRAQGVEPRTVLEHAIEMGHTGLYYKTPRGKTAGAAVSDATAAWLQVRAAIGAGAMPATWKHRQTAAALEAVGGWARLKNAESRQLDFTQQRFEAAFNQGAH